MNLSKKTLVYSSLLAGILVILMIGYFVFMLPSLYVDHMEEDNRNSIVATQKSYLESKTYGKAQVKNPTGLMTMEIPKEGNQVRLVNVWGSWRFDITDSYLQKILKECQRIDSTKKINKHTKTIKKLLHQFSDHIDIKKDLPVQVTTLQENKKNQYKEESTKVYEAEQKIVVYEYNATDGKNHYATYLAMSMKKKSFIITVLPVVKPDIEEIRPIILESMPMILAVAILLILVMAKCFSDVIVGRIEQLAMHASYVKEMGIHNVIPLKVEGSDEITILADTLNELYSKLEENYQLLEEQAKRQEVFLRASSHQLKTPVAAGLLLVDGMIHQVGKYKDTDTYLPEVKEQLLSMQKIISDILYMNHRAKDIILTDVEVKGLLEQCMEAYDIHAKEKNVSFLVRGKEQIIETDQELLEKIIDNLISNSLKYCYSDHTIVITLEEGRILIENTGDQIDAELLPHILEPFVSGNTKEKGHGLGLYLASYYARQLHMQLEIENTNTGVRSTLQYLS